MNTDNTQIRRIAIVRPGRSGFELIGLPSQDPAPAPDFLATAAIKPRSSARLRLAGRRPADRPQPPARVRAGVVTHSPVA
jgi:hypothetical protein